MKGPISEQRPIPSRESAVVGDSYNRMAGTDNKRLWLWSNFYGDYSRNRS